MNTVEALNVLGKALCGDSFEVKPGLTDAETILEIAKNYSGGGSGSGARIIDMDTLPPASDGTEYAAQYEVGLTVNDFANTYIRQSYRTWEEPHTPVVQMASVAHATKVETEDHIVIIDSKDNGTNVEYWYYPETGNLLANLKD